MLKFYVRIMLVTQLKKVVHEGRRQKTGSKEISLRYAKHGETVACGSHSEVQLYLYSRL